eukprot:GSA120T00005495001.1
MGLQCFAAFSAQTNCASAHFPALVHRLAWSACCRRIGSNSGLGRDVAGGSPEKMRSLHVGGTSSSHSVIREDRPLILRKNSFEADIGSPLGDNNDRFFDDNDSDGGGGHAANKNGAGLQLQQDSGSSSDAMIAEVQVDAEGNEVSRKQKRPPQIMIHAVVEDVLKSPMFRRIPGENGREVVVVDEEEADRVGTLLLSTTNAERSKKEKFLSSSGKKGDNNPLQKHKSEAGSGNSKKIAPPNLSIGKHSTVPANTRMQYTASSDLFTDATTSLTETTDLHSSNNVSVVPHQGKYWKDDAFLLSQIKSIASGSPVSGRAKTSAQFFTPNSASPAKSLRLSPIAYADDEMTPYKKIEKKRTLYSPALSPSRRGGESMLLQSPGYRSMGMFPTNNRAGFPSYVSPDKRQNILQGLEEKRQEREAKTMVSTAQERKTRRRVDNMAQSVSVFQRVADYDIIPGSPPSTMPNFRKSSKDLPAAQLYGESVNREQINARGQITPWFSPEGRKMHKDLSLSFLPDRDYADKTAIKNEAPKKFSLLSQLRHAKAAKGSLINAQTGHETHVSATPVFQQIEYLLREVCQTGIGAASPKPGARGRTLQQAHSLQQEAAEKAFVPSCLRFSTARRAAELPTLEPPAEGRMMCADRASYDGLNKVVLRERELMLLRKIMALYSYSVGRGYSCWEMYLTRSLWARFCVDCGLVHPVWAPFHWVLQVFDQYATPVRQHTLQLEATSLKLIEHVPHEEQHVHSGEEEEDSKRENSVGRNAGGILQKLTDDRTNKSRQTRKTSKIAGFNSPEKSLAKASSKDSWKLEDLSLSPGKDREGVMGKMKSFGAAAVNKRSSASELMVKSASVLMGKQKSSATAGSGSYLPTLLNHGESKDPPNRPISKQKSMSAVDVAAELLRKAEGGQQVHERLKGGQQVQERAADKNPRPSNIYMRLFYKKKRAIQEKRKRKALEREMKQERKKLEYQKKQLQAALQNNGSDALAEEIAKLNMLLEGKTPQHFPIEMESDASDDDLKMSGLSLSGPQVLHFKEFARAAIHVARQFYPTRSDLQSSFFDLEEEEGSSDEERSRRNSSLAQRTNSIATNNERPPTSHSTATSLNLSQSVSSTVGVLPASGPRLLNVEDKLPSNNLISKIFFLDEVVRDDGLQMLLRGTDYSKGGRVVSPSRQDHEQKLNLALEENKKSMWRNRRVRNCFLEPEIIHLVCAYQELFQILFEAYRENADEGVTLESFLRMCEDFELVPAFGSLHAFESAYKNSECAEEPESPRNEVTRQLKATPPITPEAIPNKLTNFVEWSANSQKLDRFTGDALWTAFFGNRTTLVDFEKFEAVVANPVLEPKISAKKVVVFWKSLVSFKVNREMGPPGTIFEKGMILQPSTAERRASRPSSKEGGTSSLVSRDGSTAALDSTPSPTRPKRRASVAVDSALLKDHGANASPPIANVSRGPTSQSGRRPSKQEPAVPVMPDGHITEFLEKTTFCAVMDPLIRDFKVRNPTFFADRKGSKHGSSGPPSKDKATKRRASTGAMPSASPGGRRGSTGDVFSPQQKRGSIGGPGAAAAVEQSRSVAAGRRQSVDLSSQRMSIGSLVKTIGHVQHARSSFRQSIGSRGHSMHQPDSDLESSSDDEAYEDPPDMSFYGTNTFSSSTNDTSNPPPAAPNTLIGTSGQPLLDKTDPEVFRSFLKKRFITLSRAWNFMCGRNQGRSFTNWAEARNVAVQLGGGQQCRTDNGRTFSYEEFEDILMTRLRYTQEKKIAERLFTNLDDDDSRSISIDEVRPDRKTNFFLAAFIESILKPVFASLIYSGHPILTGGMTYMKFLLFLTHLKRTVAKKAQELTPANIKQLTSEIVSPAFEPASSDSEPSEVEPLMDNSEEDGTGENFYTPKKWSRSQRKITDKYFRRDLEFRKWATDKEKLHSMNKVTRAQSSAAKLNLFNWVDPPMADARLNPDPVNNARRPTVPSGNSSFKAAAPELVVPDVEERSLEIKSVPSATANCPRPGGAVPSACVAVPQRKPLRKMCTRFCHCSAATAPQVLSSRNKSSRSARTCGDRRVSRDRGQGDARVHLCT